jgi:hypothetical protein
MALHLIKLCVGASSVEDLAQWQEARLAEARVAKRKPELWHRTRMFPKRREDILAGGSLYWVIKGVVQVRQLILDLRRAEGDDGIARCDIVLGHELVAVRPVPRRPFQGWRYLAEEDSPADLKKGETGFADLPAKMRADLLALGLL